MIASRLTALGLLSCTVLTMRIVAADSDPLPAITFTVQGIRITQDYRPQQKVPGLAGNPALQRQFNDPWGIWRPGIHLRLSIASPENWALLTTDQLTATARMDSGEVLSQEHPSEQDNGIMNDTSANSDRAIWPNQNDHEMDESTLGLQLRPPTKSCSSITSLAGRVRLVLGDLTTLKTVHIVPRSGDPQTVPGTDLVIGITTDGKVSFGYNDGTLKELHDVQLLCADGSSPIVNSSGTTGNNKHETMTFGTSKPVAAVDLHFFQHFRAMMTDFTFIELSLAGSNDPSLLSRPSSAMNEIAMPLLAPAPEANPIAAPPVKKGASSY